MRTRTCHCRRGAARRRRNRRGRGQKGRGRASPLVRNAGGTRRGAGWGGASAGAGSRASSSGDPLDTKRVVIAMGVVLGAIFGAHQVWRRLGMPGTGSKASGALQVVSRMAISPKQQLLLVRVGRRCVLVANSG